MVAPNSFRVLSLATGIPSTFIVSNASSSVIPLTFNTPLSSNPEPLVGDVRRSVGAVVSTSKVKV